MATPTAEIRRWKAHPSFPECLKNGVPPQFVEGFFYDDKTGINHDGSYGRVGTIQYVTDDGKYYTVGTETYTYRCFKSEELKDEKNKGVGTP